MVTFQVAADRVLGHEGGYVNDPDDPGGETKWGISKRQYFDLDIKNLTRDQALHIYKRDFWDAIEAGELPDGVVFQLFDFAFNSGIGTAIRQFQRAIGVSDDGHFGKISRARAKSMSESDLNQLLIAQRIDYLTGRSTWAAHGKGWMRRMATNLRYSAQDS